MRIVNILDAFDSVVGEIEDRFKHGGVKRIGLPTGFSKLDEITGGFRKKSLYILGGRTGHGKLLRLDTPVPTPFGWKTMEHIRIGDVLFDENGKLCTVSWVGEINYQPNSYRVTFEDGSHIDACADHQWVTHSARARKSASEAKRKRPNNRPVKCRGTDQTHKRTFASIVTTQQIRDTLITENGKRLNHAVQVAQPLQLPPADLPIPPYTLGAWLGDGTSSSSGFTGIDVEIIERIRADGYDVTGPKYGKSWIIVNLVTQTKALGVWKNKHIPQDYLRASYEQRLELLRGLMDTDGHIAKDSCCEITQKNKILAYHIKELIHTLGMKATIEERRQKSQNGTEGSYYRIKFRPIVQVFHLKRKAARWNPTIRETQKYRYIVSVEPIEPVPMRCISVDSPSNLYLVGEAMIPTHNSSMALTMANAVAQKHKVCYHSAEMDAGILVTRFIAGVTLIPAYRIERGDLSQTEMNQVGAVRDILAKMDFTVSDDRPTSKQLAKTILAYKEEHGLDWLCVDYLSLLTDPGTSETERLERIVGNVSALAVEADIPILGLVQLNRESDSKDNLPSLRNIRYSDRIAQDASGVWFIQRPYYYAQREEGLPPLAEEKDAKLIIDKNRFGGPGEIACVFHAQQMRWSQFEPEITEQPTMSNDGPLARRVKEGR